MDEELKQKLNASGAELLDWMKGAAEKGGDFLAEQAPLLADEIVAWHFWSSVFCAALFGLLGLLVFGIGALCVWACIKSEETQPEPICFSIALLIAGIGVAVSGVGMNGYEAVKAAVAPRIVIIEYAGQALGGGR